MTDLRDLGSVLQQFAEERDWDQFHTPKNLVMALAVEVAELMEHFQWVEGGESSNLTAKTLAEVREEIGDVMIYLLRLVDKLGIDPLDAAWDKIEINQRKYPAQEVRGRSKKYSEY